MTAARKAVMLAAGRGLRLAGSGWRHPKCLLEFGGETLLARHARILATHGVEEWVLAVGYERELVEAALPGIDRLEVRTVHNPDWDRGSNLTLWHVREELGDNVLLMDADVLYHPQLIARLQASEHDNCLLLDRDYEHDGEAVEIGVRDGRPVEFTKAAQGTFDYTGESVGFFRFSAAITSKLVDACGRYVASDRLDQPYEDAIRDLVRATPSAFGFEDITGLAWIEIDYPDDVTRARSEILPRV